MKELSLGSPRWAFFREIRKKKPADVAKMLVVNIILSISLVLPILVFEGERNAEMASTTHDKLPWLRFYENPSTSVYVSWETNATTGSCVEYGVNSALLNLSVVNATPTDIHHVCLTGLLPNTTYYYRTGTNDTGTPVLGHEYSFTTAPDTIGTPFTFLAVSDTQESGLGISYSAPVAAAIAREINASNPRFILHDGDVTNVGWSQASWSYYFKYAGAYTPYMPLEPALGNHDDMDQNNFRSYFCARTFSEPLYYSFNYSSVHVLVLEIPSGTQAEFTAPMMAFVSADLASAASMPYRIVMFHCPLISSGFFGFNQVVSDHLRALFAADNVSLVVQGHDHHYERLLLGNVTYVVIGGGGGEQDPCYVTWPETQAIASIPHFARITVTNTSMTFEALTAENTVFDRAVISPST